MIPFTFEILHQSSRSRARVGRIHTPHGMIDTPNFVAVGTNGVLKALDNQMVQSIGLQLMFCNTYHLMLQPGTHTIKQAGGIHRFINRHLPIITDSGGFQLFSLKYGGVANELKSKGGKKNESFAPKVTDDGVVFRSYRDGKRVLLTPELSIQAQKAFGADIIVSFDELPPYHISLEALSRSLDRTHEWEKRSLDTHLENPQGQAIYAVVHGNTNYALREKSCRFLSRLPFDGYAIGGSMGKTRKEMVDMLKFTLTRLPRHAPNHLLGIADLPSLKACVPLGIDTFDSSYPTKVARHGTLLTQTGPIKVIQAIYKNHFMPPCKECSCYTCRHYTLAYLHHLFKAKELSGLTLASIHNLHFMVELMVDYKNKILLNHI